MQQHGSSGLFGEQIDTFSFDGQAVHYWTIGGGAPLVLVHGTPFSSYVWRRIAPHLAREYQVIGFDLLGYGKSEKRAGQDVSLGVQNEVMSCLLDHLGVGNPHVVAHDFGGATALRTHLLNGRQFRSITLIDAVTLSPWGSPFVQHVREHEKAFSGLPDYIHEAVLEAYIAGAAYNKLSPEAMNGYKQPWCGAVGKAAFYRQIAQMDEKYTTDIERRLEEVRCPVTVIWGEQDSWLPVDQGRRLAQQFPAAQLHIIRGAAHLVQEDAPEAILGVLLFDALKRAQ